MPDTEVLYRSLPGPWDWIAEVEDVLDRLPGRRVADLGGGAFPVLPLEAIERRGLDYVVIDISKEELDKAPAGYQRHQGDVAKAGFSGGQEFDLVLSRWLLEHVEDPEQVHRNIYESLVPGGLAMHFFPTLYALPFLANRALPERSAGSILRRADDAHGAGRRGKFRALYRWCRGPTRKQIERFEGLGFQVEQYIGYYGHPYYRRVPAIDRAYRWLSRNLVKRPVPALTSFASLVLQRPPQ